MIKLVPELPSQDIDLKTELPIIDRYHSIMDGVDETIYELNQMQDKEIPIGIEFGIYGGVHGSLISDYMAVVTHAIEGEPPLINMFLRGGPDEKEASTDFEECHDPKRLKKYNDIIRWLLEKHGAAVNLKVRLDPVPNPYATFADGTVRFVSPLSNRCSYMITNSRYLDIFGIANSMINQSNETENVHLKEIVHLGYNDGMQEYTFDLAGKIDIEEAA